MDKPEYLDMFRLKRLRLSIRNMTMRGWLRLAVTIEVFTALSYFVAINISALMSSAGLASVDPITYPFPHLDWYILLPMVLVIPIFEEWIFRGIILREIKRRWNSWVLALVGSALIFAVFHLSNPGMLPASMIPLTISGLILGWCYLSGGLLAAILSHCAYNAIVAIIILTTQTASGS